MKKKILVCLLVFAFVVVFAASWNCGCAFAQMAPQVTESPSSETDCGHEASSSNTTGDEANCCSGCQLQEIAQIPSLSHISAILQNIPSHVSGLSPLLASHVSHADPLKNFLGMFRSSTSAIRVSSPEAPLYLQIQVLLI